MLGLETALALAITELDLEIDRIVGLLSWQPAAIIGVDDRHGRPVAEGNPANLCVFDPEEEWTIDPHHHAEPQPQQSLRRPPRPRPGRPHDARRRTDVVDREPVR